MLEWYFLLTYSFPVIIFELALGHWSSHEGLFLSLIQNVYKNNPDILGCDNLINLHFQHLVMD
jgi:hypothetical protein